MELKALLAYSSEFKEHVPPDAHPERPERLDALMEGLRWGAERLGVELVGVSVRPASDEEILLAHDEVILQVLRAISGGQGYIDPDTYFSPRSSEVARLAVGAGLEMVQGLLKGEAPLGIAPLRPPGHHATRHHMMGFCLLNNVAIAAAKAIELGLERVAIYDFDVHHGNGTQDIFYQRSDVLYISTHQWGIYPGTGHSSERGVGPGEGYTVNVPMRWGDGDEELLEALRERILPAIRDYRPQLILLSAGFDCMRGDPIGGLAVTREGIREMLKEVFRTAMELGVPVGLFLEGGYSMENLHQAGEALLEAYVEVYGEVM